MEDLVAPKAVAVVGGSRWARVLLGVLSEVAPAGTRLSSHSKSNAAGMAQWAESRGLSGRIKTSASLPAPDKSTAVLIANMAKDHEAAALPFLDAGCAVFLEKPLTPDSKSAERLVERARKGGARLAASQVFLFARSVENFAALARKAGKIESLAFRWSDPRGETRHGEAKRHDDALPVFPDVFPHVAAIASALLGPTPFTCRAAASGGGGNLVEADLLAGAVPLSARIERYGAKRERILTAVAGEKTFILDFSAEPGTIASGGKTQNADPLWDSAPRPVTAMLSAFLPFAAGRPADARLDPGIALEACRAADAVAARTR